LTGPKNQEKREGVEVGFHRRILYSRSKKLLKIEL